jgi:hypothetical protein
MPCPEQLCTVLPLQTGMEQSGPAKLLSQVSCGVALLGVGVGGMVVWSGRGGVIVSGGSVFERLWQVGVLRNPEQNCVAASHGGLQIA